MDKYECTVLFSVRCSSVSIANLPAVKLGESVNGLHCQDTFRWLAGKIVGFCGRSRQMINAEIRRSNDLNCIWNSSYCPSVALNKKQMARSGFIVQVPEKPLSWTILLDIVGLGKLEVGPVHRFREIGGGTAPDTVFG
jgi:hypothetical protein